MLGAAWRVNLALARRRHRRLRRTIRRRPARPAAPAAHGRLPYWDDRHPDHRPASEVLRRAVFSQRPAAVSRPARRARGSRSGSATTSSTTRAAPSFVVDVSAHYERKREALACHRIAVHAGRSRRSVATRLTAPRFRQLIESRDAQLGALTGVAFAEGIVLRSRCCASLVAARRTAAEASPMNIGIVCYASVGGSGIVATELAKCLARARARRAHDQHRARRSALGDYQPGLSFHRVDTPAYPLFREPQYLLSLATSIVHVARARRARHHPRALRRAACHGGVPGAADSRSTRRDGDPRPAAWSRRCTAPTSRWSAAIPRMPRRSRSRSSSRTA